MSEELDNDRIKEAWDRVARTSDGIVVYRHLQRVRLGLAPAPANEGALPWFEGRRSLAADLMAYMAEGIGENDRACITFAVAKPAPIGASRGAGRRVTANTFVAGYDDASDPTFTAPGSSSTGGNGGAGGNST